MTNYVCMYVRIIVEQLGILNLTLYLWSLQPFSQGYDLASTTVLYMIGKAYRLKPIPNVTFLSNFSWKIYLLSEFFPEEMFK